MAETGIWRVRADEDTCKNTEFLNTFLTTFPENVPAPLEMLKTKK